MSRAGSFRDSLDQGWHEPNMKGATMNTIAASVVILAGAMLVAAGVVAEAVKAQTGTLGIAVGFLLLLIGGVVFVGGAFKPMWDAIPVDAKKKDETAKRE